MMGPDGSVCEAQFLGHVMGTKGLATDPAKMEAVKSWLVPQSVSDMHNFLWLSSYYRCIVRNFASIASPLHCLTNKKQLRETEWWPTIAMP